MKLPFLAGIVAALACSPALSAQTFFSLHAGSDGVGVDVTNASPYFPVLVAPAPPVHHVHVPLMPGYYPEPSHKRYKKAAKEYRKAAKHYRKAMQYQYQGVYGIPAGLVYYDDDDIEDYYEDYYKHARKAAKKYRKYHKKHKHDKHKKHHHKHHHDDDDD